MEVKLIPIGVACGIALLLAQANLAVIFTGGAGKNGSTIAVRIAPHDNLTYNTASLHLNIQTHIGERFTRKFVVSKHSNKRFIIIN